VFAWEAVRPLRRQRLCVSSFLLAGLTGLIMWVAVDAPLRLMAEQLAEPFQAQG